jgi:hypothetical protein
MCVDIFYTKSESNQTKKKKYIKYARDFIYALSKIWLSRKKKKDFHETHTPVQ